MLHYSLLEWFRTALAQELCSNRAYAFELWLKIFKKKKKRLWFDINLKPKVQEYFCALNEIIAMSRSRRSHRGTWKKRGRQTISAPLQGCGGKKQPKVLSEHNTNSFKAPTQRLVQTRWNGFKTLSTPCSDFDFRRFVCFHKMTAPTSSLSLNQSLTSLQIRPSGRPPTARRRRKDEGKTPFLYQRLSAGWLFIECWFECFYIMAISFV